MDNFVLEKIDSSLLKSVADLNNIPTGAFSLVKNGQAVKVSITPNVNILPKSDKPGIDIYIREDTKGETVYIPVIITESGIEDVFYYDFHIGKNADVRISGGCGIHNDGCKDSQHNGIHRFFLDEGAKVLYVEKHYGGGDGNGKRILNPVTELYIGKNATLEMQTSQIKGVDSTVRTTKSELYDGASLVITEKILTHDQQLAETNFDVNLNGVDSKVHVTSRSIATENSTQRFNSKVYGNNKCFGHVECDAILKDNGIVTSTPEITANCVEANLIHEAAIGKIAGDQIIKLMTLGLTEREAEEAIINGFLK